MLGNAEWETLFRHRWSARIGDAIKKLQGCPQYQPCGSWDCHALLPSIQILLQVLQFLLLQQNIQWLDTRHYHRRPSMRWAALRISLPRIIVVKGCFQKRWGPDRTIECIQIYNYEEVYAYEKAYIIFIWTTKPFWKRQSWIRWDGFRPQWVYFQEFVFNHLESFCMIELWPSSLQFDGLGMGVDNKCRESH